MFAGGLRLTAIDAITGASTSWNPSPNDFVSTLLVSGGALYVGGYFSQIAGATRNGFAAFDVTNGALTSLDPDFGWTNALLVSNGFLYVGTWELNVIPVP